MQSLDYVIVLSDLYETVGAEGRQVTALIDAEVLPAVRSRLWETDPIGLGDRFGRVIDKVRATIDHTGKDRIRTLKDMMQSALRDYVRKTHDAMTARDMFHRAIMSGSDTMLTVTAATILANALAGMHPQESQLLVQRVASRLSGKQPSEPAFENASSAAVGAAAIATTARKKKKSRKDSLFAETNRLSWDDLLGRPTAIEILHEVRDTGREQRHDGIMIDPTTAELVLAVYHGLSPAKQRQYEAKSLAEMVDFAYHCVKNGLIEVSLQEA